MIWRNMIHKHINTGIWIGIRFANLVWCLNTCPLFTRVCINYQFCLKLNILRISQQSLESFLLNFKLLTVYYTQIFLKHNGTHLHSYHKSTHNVKKIPPKHLFSRNSWKTLYKYTYWLHSEVYPCMQLVQGWRPDLHEAVCVYVSHMQENTASHSNVHINIFMENGKIQNIVCSKHLQGRTSLGNEIFVCNLYFVCYLEILNNSAITTTIN